MTAEGQNKAIKTAIVTGAARGIGRAIALRLATEGYDVTIADLPAMRDEAEGVANEIERSGRKSHVFCLDVSKREEVERMCVSHIQKLGPLFAMVANAGIAQPKSSLNVTEEDMRRIFEVNVYGVFNCYQVAAKHMIEQGTEGRIIGCSRCVDRPNISQQGLANRVSSQQHCRSQSSHKLSALQRE